MPHFFAIAIRRHDDYAAAGIPVMPVKNGLQRTKFSMLIYIIEFMLAASLLFIFGYAGIVYLAIALVLGVVWLAAGLRGFWLADGGTHASERDRAWARQMFFLSLIVMMVLFITIAVGAVV
jgi:protoheme IX farnesyltransferase